LLIARPRCHPSRLAAVPLAPQDDGDKKTRRPEVPPSGGLEGRRAV
jgi:hypothetical protein